MCTKLNFWASCWQSRLCDHDYSRYGSGFVLIRKRYKYALFARVFSLRSWRFSNILDRNLRLLSRPPARSEIRIRRHLAKADTNCFIVATAAGLWLLCDVLVTVPPLLLPEKSVKRWFYAPMPLCARRVVSIWYKEKYIIPIPEN